MILRFAAAAIAAAALAGPAQAALDLSTYKVTLQRDIDFDEASGVTYNYDRNVLTMVDDEGDDIADFSLTGTRLSADKLRNRDVQTGGYRDVEGIAYLGNGQYALAEERTEEIVRVGVASSNGTVGGLPSSYYTDKPAAERYLINGGTAVGNNGLEGIALDPVTGGFFGVRQGGTATIAPAVYFSQVAFGTPTTGTTTRPFDPSSLLAAGTTLADVAVLAQVPGFAGTDYFSNLLLLSGDGRMLYEVTRTGGLVSSLSLAGLNAPGVFEGITLDRQGNIYLVDDRGNVGNARGAGLTVLGRAVAPVPEPATWALMLVGFAMVGATALA